MISRSIENLKNHIKPCLCQKKTMVMQSFFPRFLPRKRLKIHKYCGSISFLSSPLWLKTSEIFRHMANIFAVYRNIIFIFLRIISFIYCVSFIVIFTVLGGLHYGILSCHGAKDALCPCQTPRLSSNTPVTSVYC